MKTLACLLFTLLTCGLASSQTYDQERVDSFARAIAKSEGFYWRGTIPNRYRNPGDLKTIRGYKYPGQIGTGKGDHAIFKSAGYGWAALKHQLLKIIEGSSERYYLDMTILEMGRMYAGRGRLWASNVARELNTPVDMTLREYFMVPPSWIIREEKE